MGHQIRSSSKSTYSNALKYFRPFCAAHSLGPAEDLKMSDEDGVPRDGMFRTFFTYLSGCAGMTISVFENATRYVQHQLQEERATLLKSTQRGYVRHLPGVSDLLQTLQAKTSSKVTEDMVDMHHDTQMNDIGIEGRKMLAASLLSSGALHFDEVDGFKESAKSLLPMSAQMCAQAHSDIQLTFMTVGRAENVRAMLYAHEFVADCRNVGPSASPYSGVPMTMTLWNKGKTNAAGHVEVHGALPHMHPLLDAAAALGISKVMRHVVNGEEYPQFSPTKKHSFRQYFKKSVSRSSTDYSKPVDYATQVRTSVLLFSLSLAAAILTWFSSLLPLLSSPPSAPPILLAPSGHALEGGGCKL